MQEDLADHQALIVKKKMKIQVKKEEDLKEELIQEV